MTDHSIILFLGGQATLFCGTHGVFSGSASPPERVGQTVVSEYTATFVGELTLEPPLVSSTVTHSLAVHARMAESITLTQSSGEGTVFATELVTFELSGTDMPEDVLVRESPGLESTGVTRITATSDGRSRVETSYEVWLEMSLDGGGSWHQAEHAVRMTLEPS